MLGKTFKGPTDEVLTWQTAQFLAGEVDRDSRAASSSAAITKLRSRCIGRWRAPTDLSADLTTLRPS
jgi:hypothetical protein